MNSSEPSDVAKLLKMKKILIIQNNVFITFTSFLYFWCHKVALLIALKVFTCEGTCCFQRILTIAILSVRLSVRLSVHLSVHLSVTRVDQSKTVQASITKFSPSAARKTLVSGTIKLLHKFEGGHPK